MRPEALLILLLLPACDGPLTDAAARSAARSAVNPVVARQFPGVPLEPATNCVINNATTSEIVTLATSSGSGANDVATRTVLDVVRRPETIDCLATDGLPVLLNSL